MEENNKNKEKIGTYKGVKDFYPEDFAKLFYIFSNWRKTSENMGYEEFNSSVLEYSDLYANKTSQEILNEQTYTFQDRGGRSVTLRPEMTPTAVRMIAEKKRELIFPLRWFCISNIFRYEQPQKGRTRESWQYNADLFGNCSSVCDAEIILLANQILLDFGLKPEDFKILINSRKSIEQEIEKKGLKDKRQELLKILDRKNKDEDFEKKLKEIIGDCEFKPEKDPEVEETIEILKKMGVNNVQLDESLVRGFDYYTGMVFEIFDTKPELRRSIAGGGRYDKLFENFGEDKIPAVGFGLGNVTLIDSLEIRGLIPENIRKDFVEIIYLSEESGFQALSIWKNLALSGIASKINGPVKKIGDAIAKAVKRGAKAVAIIGSEELTTGQVTIKNLTNQKQLTISTDQLVEKLSDFLN